MEPESKPDAGEQPPPTAERIVERVDPSRRASGRDPWFDNAKFWLVALVVLGHAWTLLPPAVRDWPYDFLYLWHVPAFVLVTGYLSRSFDFTKARLRGLVRTVLVPYLLFEGALAAFRVYVGGEDLELLWANPHWPMWYLSALFFWRLLTPAFKRMRLSIATAVLISVVAGARATDTFDLARVLGLLPFFVIGLRLRPDHLDALRGPRARRIGLAVLLGLLVFAAFNDVFFSTEWLYYRSRYADLESSDLQAALIRVVLLALGAAGALAALAVLPRRRSWFTQLGAASLVVYLFHGFAIKGAEFAGFTDWAEVHGWLALAIVTPSAPLLAVLLALPPVAQRLNVLVDPVGAISRARERRRERAEGRAPTSG